VDAHEVVQLYVSAPGAGALTPLPIPYRSLQGYTRVLLKAGETMPVSFTLTPAQYSTTLANGTMTVLSGEYKIAVSGHQPDDAAGLAASNVATGSFAV
jgi:beta-glucosidase